MPLWSEQQYAAVLDALASSYVQSNGEAFPGRAYAAVPVTTVCHLLGDSYTAGSRVLMSMLKFNLVSEVWNGWAWVVLRGGYCTCITCLIMRQSGATRPSQPAHI